MSTQEREATAPKPEMDIEEAVHLWERRLEKSLDTLNKLIRKSRRLHGKERTKNEFAIAEQWGRFDELTIVLGDLGHHETIVKPMIEKFTNKGSRKS